MPLSKKEHKYLEALDLFLLDKVGELEEMEEKHRSRVERSRAEDKDYSLANTLDSIKERIDEARAYLNEAVNEYADR